jgi:anti-sigma B factor antagonist
MCFVDGASHANSSESSTSQPVTRLSLQEHTVSGERTLVLSGELDLASRPLFDDALHCIEQRQAAALVLDLSEVTFMDSTGLHGVLAAKSLCARSGCEFVVVRGSSQVQRLFELSGVLDELPFRSAPAA